MGGRLMVYKVLDCRDFITLLLFYTIGGHHREILHLLWELSVALFYCSTHSWREIQASTA